MRSFNLQLIGILVLLACSCKNALDAPEQGIIATSEKAEKMKTMFVGT